MIDQPEYSGAVLWDLDGVLVDTGEFHFQAWCEILARLKISMNRDAFNQFFGMDNPHTLEAILGYMPDPDWCSAISAEKEHLFRTAIAGKVELLPGVREWLVGLAQMGIPQALASSAPPENVRALLDETGAGKYFLSVVCAEELPGKPDPAVFLAAAHALQRCPGSCIVIEDSLAGLQAACSAGMKCIAVTSTQPAERLQQADLIVPSLAGLPLSVLLSLFEAGN